MARKEVLILIFGIFAIITFSLFANVFSGIVQNPVNLIFFSTLIFAGVFLLFASITRK